MVIGGECKPCVSCSVAGLSVWKKVRNFEWQGIESSKRFWDFFLIFFYLQF